MASKTFKMYCPKDSALQNGHFSSDPSSVDVLKSLAPGNYSVNVASSTVFPSQYGILEVIKGTNYGICRFSKINTSSPAVWHKSWNVGTDSWYDNNWVKAI